MNGKSLRPLGILLGLAVLLRLYFIVAFDYISPDGAQYVRLGYSIWHGLGYSSGGAMFPDIIQPPLYPFVAGFFTLFMPPLLAGKTASLIAGVLLVYVVYRFLSLLAGKETALIGGGLTLIHPGLIAISAQAATEAWYILFVALLFFEGWRFWESPGRGRGLRLALWFSLGFLTRPEMLVVMFFYVAFLFSTALYGKIRPRPGHGLALLLPSAATVLLYAAAVSLNLGYFTLSPKINFVRIQSKLAAIARAGDADFKTLPPRTAAYRAFYPLTPDGGELLSHALLYKKEPAMRWLREHRTTGAGFSPARLLGGVLKNAKKMLSKIAGGKGLPWFLALTAFLGLFYLFKENRVYGWYLVLMLMPLSIYLFVHIEDRFLLGSWPMLVLPAARIFERLYEKFRVYFSPLLAGAVPLLLLFVLLLGAYGKMVDDFKATGRWKLLSQKVRDVVEPGARLMAKQPQTAFFLDAEYRLLPFGSVEKLLLYFQKQKVDYLLVDEADLTLNPALEAFVDSRGAAPLTPLREGSVEGRSYWLFHIK